MTAQSLEVDTLVLSDPEWSGPGSTDKMLRVNSTMSFEYPNSFDILTLSTTGAIVGSDVTGLLYVPDLAPSDPCINASAPYVPQNVTRRSNLPRTNYNLVGLAPWFNSECTLAYLEAAKMQAIRGMLFYIPGNGTGPPPETDSSFYDLGDGGQWQRDNQYPVYIISGAGGALLMHESSLYSGNMTEVPFGHELTEVYDSRDYVRLYASLNTGGDSGLPSLWIFLLVVFGMLFGVIALTSFSMHLLLRRRRNSLRRRVASGEVDLEALGIQRLTVPSEIMDEMPLLPYGTDKNTTTPLTKDVSAVEEKIGNGTVPSTLNSPPQTSSTYPKIARHEPALLVQPTCAICLDDFVPATESSEGTMVRVLPCRHIFHPECVDAFLQCSSSLCPMCKKSALPPGHCPRVITNAMVRRERMVRGIRERVTVDNSFPHNVTRRGSQLRDLTSSSLSQLRRSVQLSSTQAVNRRPSNSVHPSQAPPSSDPTASDPAVTAFPVPVPVQVQPPATPARREWARQRAMAMLGRTAPLDPDAEDARNTTRWQKVVRGIFPGYRQ